MNARERIARRAAQEFKDGMFVNLGIGIPVLAANYIAEEVDVTLQSENGILGFGPNPEVNEVEQCFCNAAGDPITRVLDTSIFDLQTSFSMIRGGHLDMTVLGALEVDQEGNIANWALPYTENAYGPGPGGAMDLLVGAKKIVVTITHNAKNGAPKILKKCTMNLSAKNAVDLIITELAVIEVTEKGLVLKEIAPETTVEEVVLKTEADLIIPDDVKTMSF
ncbi:3-oxoacid CoA-transferase subunit B [Clostridium aestuarii]|uniref:3-oxoacid CoA-transferase subunit B n=1 Tax=Clostridium aestuarii TaxID=338193 RepID=A0ABT4D4K6_9CLOT|nr:3-oxoacid CoA-transferase subunit B [Clostridium aestuarii]MCY6485165.1 3-oxoacid CoA-transferase subunit B [Clostridium aestuarii]